VALRGLAAPGRRGCLIWLVVLLAVAVGLALLTIVSPPVLFAGVVLAALVVANPHHAGDAVRTWAVRRRVPLLRSQTMAAGFVLVLLLYTVPVPGLLTASLVSDGHSTGTARSAEQPRPTAPASSPGSDGASAVAPPTAAPTPTTAPTGSPTPTPTRVATPAPAALRTPPPAPAPGAAETCSASVEFPTPGDGGDETVYVTSNVPNSTVTIVAHYKTTNHTFTAATDARGSASDTFSIGRPTIGFTVAVDVAVGSASCSTSFTPQ
jgi:hypothetical protein